MNFKFWKHKVRPEVIDQENYDKLPEIHQGGYEPTDEEPTHRIETKKKDPDDDDDDNEDDGLDFTSISLGLEALSGIAGSDDSSVTSEPAFDGLSGGSGGGGGVDGSF